VEIVFGLVMIAAGIAVAIFVMIAIAIGRGEKPADQGARDDRQQVAASILHQVLVAGDVPADEVLKRLRRDAGLAARITPSVDVASWGETYARMSSDDQRRWLLEMAVQLAAARRGAVPLRQYTALLELSFSLGFRTDALARLREKYRFEYVDHAKDARPREADRTGGATPLFVREQIDTRELLRVLEIEGIPTRQTIISAYRKLASRHHPDHHVHEPEAAREHSAAQFIEITRAYEQLLAIYRD